MGKKTESAASRLSEINKFMRDGGGLGRGGIDRDVRSEFFKRRLAAAREAEAAPPEKPRTHSTAQQRLDVLSDAIADGVDTRLPSQRELRHDFFMAKLQAERDGKVLDKNGRYKRVR